MRVGKDLLKEVVSPETPKPLTGWELLSQVAGLYDLIGLVTPAKQKVRKAVGRVLAAWANSKSLTPADSRETMGNHLLTQKQRNGNPPCRISPQKWSSRSSCESSEVGPEQPWWRWSFHMGGIPDISFKGSQPGK